MAKEQTMGNDVREVRDRPTEIWVKLLGIIAVFTFPLIGTIGTLLIQGQLKTNEELSEMNGYLQTHESRISRNEKDIRHVWSVSAENLERIYKLEGSK